MKRPARARGGTSVSLFPFLAVLLCTMGSLIVVLVVIAQQARSQAQRQEIAQLQRLEEQRREALATAAQLEQQRAAALAQRDDLQAMVAARQRELEALSARIAALEGELAELQRQASQMPATVDASTQDELETQLAWYRKRIAEVEDEIRAANQRHGNGKTFAILPFGGRSSTDRRPIYIECRADRVVLQPSGIELTPADFIHSRALSPLNAALLATIDHYEQLDPLQRGYSYPLLLVRPDGIESYYKVLEALHQFRSQYGYEFIEQDWELVLPPEDQQLAAKQQEAIQQARRQLLRELQTRPSLVRGKPPSFSLSASGSGLKMVDAGKPGGLDDLPDRYGADPLGNARETGRGGYPDGPVAGGGGLPGPGGSGLGGQPGIGGMSGEPGGSGSLAGPRYPDPGQFTSTPYDSSDPLGLGSGGNGAEGPLLASPGGDQQAPGSGMNGSAAMNGAPMSGSAAMGGTGQQGMATPGASPSPFGQPGGTGKRAGDSFAGGQPSFGGQPSSGASSSSQAGGTPSDRGYWITGGERPAPQAPSGGSYGWGRSDDRGRTSTNPYANLDLAGSAAAGNASSGTPSAGGGSAGDPNEPNANLATSGTNAANSGAAGGAAGSAGSGTSDANSEGTTAGGSSGGSSRPGSTSAGGAAGGTDMSEPPEGAAGMPQLTMQHAPATRSVATTAGHNWALPYGGARSVAVWRDIRVRLEPNQLILHTETGRATQLVPLRGPTADSAYEIRNAVWEDMKHWGIAGYGMHWQPVLHVDVAPGAEWRFRDLQVLFENSGFAIRDRNAPQQPATRR